MLTPQVPLRGNWSGAEASSVGGGSTGASSYQEGSGGSQAELVRSRAGHKDTAGKICRMYVLVFVLKLCNFEIIFVYYKVLLFYA